ncbi:helicase-related protein [Cuniculiplasma sp. SKW3]|uniref:helicase-related protein n=1 Tax=Cuniculiplasma sp. SKW3 TaxID=3400170 RepID=UPI003FD21593
MAQEIPELNGVIPRPYQIEAYSRALDSNLLLVLPTGLGKTVVAALVSLYYLKQNKAVIMLSPTRPLVDQHLKTMMNLFQNYPYKINAITGHNPVIERMSMWAESNMVISTPQTVEKDIKRGIVFLNKFYLLIVDEAHRATGNYSYVSVAKEISELPGRRILAMTASPGSKNEKIEEIRENLSIKNVIIKTDSDPDIAKYVKGSDIEPLFINPAPEQKMAIDYLSSARDDMLSKLQVKFPFVRKRSSRADMSKYIRDLSARASAGEKNLFSDIPYFTAIVRMDVLSEYLETQGIEIGYDYLKEMRESEERSLQRTYNILSKNPDFIRGSQIIESAITKYVNPKFKAVMNLCEEMIRERPDSRCIVFTHYRKTSEFLMKFLSENSKIIKPLRFVGQSGKGIDKGMSQKDQREGIERFKEGQYNVMLATSVAEEGLDIPSTDLVIFYEPVASEIRSIQRRGRTGRFRHGSVFILIFSNTRDQAYYFSSQNKERNMIANMKSEMERKKPKHIDEY